MEIIRMGLIISLTVNIVLILVIIPLIIWIYRLKVEIIKQKATLKKIEDLARKGLSLQKESYEYFIGEDVEKDVPHSVAFRMYKPDRSQTPPFSEFKAQVLDESPIPNKCSECGIVLAKSGGVKVCFYQGCPNQIAK